MATVTFNRSIRENKASKTKVPFTCKLDFANVTPEQLMDLASDQIIISLQGAARRAMEAKDNKKTFAQHVNEMLNTTVNVKKHLENARAPGKSAQEKITETFAKLDPATRKALLAELSRSAK